MVFFYIFKRLREERNLRMGWGPGDEKKKLFKFNKFGWVGFNG